MRAQVVDQQSSGSCSDVAAVLASVSFEGSRDRSKLGRRAQYLLFFDCGIYQLDRVPLAIASSDIRHGPFAVLIAREAKGLMNVGLYYGVAAQLGYLDNV